MRLETLAILVLIVIWSLGSIASEKAAAGALQTLSAGRKPSSHLKMKSSRVPQFEIHKAQGKIPRIDIGEEPRYSAEVETPAVPKAPDFVFRLEKRPVSSVRSEKPAKIPSVGAPRLVAEIKEATPPAPLAEVRDPEATPSAPQPRALNPLSPDETKLLEAQITLENHGSPETALGLLVELLDHKTIGTEARHSYALAARQLGLHSEFRSLLFKIAQDSRKDWARKATESLVREAEVLPLSDMKALAQLVERHEIDTSGSDAYNFYRAKYFLESGELGQVLDALEMIPEKSRFRNDALLISALFEYRRGKIDEAESRLERLLSETSYRGDLKDVAQLTLARVQFQKNRYKESFATYMKVDRASPLWLEAMVEQAWAQILTQDYEGAAGNMFSLHTDFFKNAFAPDSYVVRTVAYLNLCQFGDGMQALQNLQRRYGPLISRLETYRQKHTVAADYYETLRSWIRNSDLREMDGLPRTFILELARHPSFLKVQNQINGFEDEIESFNKAHLALIQREKELLQRQVQTKDDLSRLKERHQSLKTADATLKLERENLERRLEQLKAQYVLAKKARGFIKPARERAQARMEKEKVDLKKKAAEALKGRFETLLAQLTQSLEQSEVLRYELLSGAGEHLRSQAAGAELNSKERPELKPAAGKAMKWKFKGEIWEDEIGHYRSSLKNVCPVEDKVAANH